MNNMYNKSISDKVFALHAAELRLFSGSIFGSGTHQYWIPEYPFNTKAHTQKLSDADTKSYY